MYNYYGPESLQGSLYSYKNEMFVGPILLDSRAPGLYKQPLETSTTTKLSSQGFGHQWLHMKVHVANASIANDKLD